MKLHFSTRPFARMPNLRLLQLNNTNLVGSFRGLFKELRWLSWHRFPMECLPSDFHPENLISLDMQRSNLHTLWRQTKFLGNLTALDLRESKSLKTTLNFTGVPNLSELRLGGCEKLSHIHNSVGNLDKLVKLDLEECKNLKSLPNSMCRLKSLEELNIGKCAKLKGLPHQLGNLKSLKSLDASNAGIKRLPDSIGCLIRLESLTLSGCKKLKKLPTSICNLTSVSVLHLERCSSLEKFPDELGDWKGLSGIYASNTRINQLPDSIGNLSDLHSLSLTNCSNLRSLPNSICKLKSLRTLRLTDCLNLQELPEKLGDLHHLEDIGVSGTRITQLPDSIQRMPYLHTLLLNNCKQLKSVPGRNLGLSLIRVLALRDCNLTDNDIPNDIWELSSLMVLDLSGNNFSCLPSGLGQLHSLQVLYASECTSLRKLPNLSTLEILRHAVLSYCDKLVEIPGLENLCSLEQIYLTGCSSLLTMIDNFFLQGYGQGLCDCKFYFSRRDIPDWFEFQGTGVSSHLFDASSDVHFGSLHLIIWVDYLFGDDGDKFMRIDVHVNNKTSGAIWESEILGRRTMSSCMIMGPVIESGDRFEVSFALQEEKDVKVEKFGVHLSSISNINSS
ncbi:putative leucine-rich repeat domain superfamily [Helianthus debilis subsp. tardiflorus]